MRDYELVVLYHPDLEIDLDKALKKVDGLIKNSGGKVSFSDNWGKRKLAYTIKKQDYAIYVYYEVQLDTAGVAKLEGLLNITDEVVRYLVSKPTPNFGDRDKPSNVDDADEESSDASDDAKAESDKKAMEDKKKPAEDKTKEAKEEKGEKKSSSASDDAKAESDKKASEDETKMTKTKDVKSSDAEAKDDKEAAEAKEE